MSEAATVSLKFRSLMETLAFVVFGYMALRGAMGFTYNGFRSANLSLDGAAELTNDGLLMVTNNTVQQTGHAFYPEPINFRNLSTEEAFSFSTEFVFAVRSELKTSGSGGFTFVIAPTKVLSGGQTMQFLGVFNLTTNGSAANHFFAVQNADNDINDNHVAIDIDTINSVKQEPAGYYSWDYDDNILFGWQTNASLGGL